MKKYVSVLLAGTALFALITAWGCGFTDETTASSTTMQSTSATTQTTSTTADSTGIPTTESAQTRETTMDTDTALIDPELPLPDIDNPITDVEPNVPDDDIIGNDGMNGDGILDGITDGGNGSQDMNGGTGGINDMSRGVGRRNANDSNPALPTK